MSFALAPGEILCDRYPITRVIGRGGMGEVYEAEDRLLRESVALKTLRADLAVDDSTVRHFQREITLARKVTHRNVCRVFDMGVHDAPGRPPLPFFTMELLRGETLYSRIRRLGRLPRETAFAAAVQMAEGLKAAHEAGVIHADFKSGNVLLVPDRQGDRVVITDFGLSRIDPASTGGDETHTISSRDIAGTLAYMSPEHMAGAPLTPASDIYSFGIVLFEMATGRLPYHRNEAIRGEAQVPLRDTISARALVPDLDLRWDAAIGRCLQQEPQRRFASAADLVQCFIEQDWGRPRHWSRRKMAGVLAASALLPLSGWWIWSRRPYHPQPGPLGWYRNGVAALHSMTYEVARRALEQSVIADPRFALAHAGLARAYEELDYSDLAKESMLRAIGAAQETRLSGSDARKLRALQFVVSRNYDGAVPLYRELEAEAPEAERAAAALETGWLAQQREDTEGAARAYDRALKLDASYAAAHLRIGYILGRRRQIDAALKAFREAEALYNASSNYEGLTETLLQQAMLLNRSSRAADAKPVIEKALTTAGLVGNVYQQVRLKLVEGVNVRNLGDPQRAILLAQEAIDTAIAQKMDNLATSALIDLGNAYLVRGDHASAEPAYRKALALAGRSRIGRIQARARMALGSLCEQDHRPAEARAFIEEGLPFYRQGGYRREFVQAMAVLGGVEQQLGEFDRGVTVLREALPAALELHDAGTEALIRDRLAENLRDQSLWPEALENFERAATLYGPAGATALLSSADIYWRVGRRQDAENSLAAAEKLLLRMPSSQAPSRLRMIRAEMAYADGRFPEAAQAGREGDRWTPLMQALVRLRTLRAAAGPDAQTVVEQIQQTGLPVEAANARLAVSEALLAAVTPAASAKATAGSLAVQALGFFEPRRIWESVWRAHWAASRAAAAASERELHLTAARSALKQMKALWPQAFLDSYLKRPDIRQISAGLKM